MFSLYFFYESACLLCIFLNFKTPFRSDHVGLTTVKRDKFSVVDFLNYGDYQPDKDKELLTKSKSKEEKGTFIIF